MYTEDEMLMLSGIQHYMFCPRQWALIHIDQQWEENKLTAEGQILHKNVDDPFYRQKNGDSIILRSIHIASKELGVYGLTDAVELISSDSPENSITHNRYKGFWKLYPVEYKRGRPKYDETDEVQLAAQVMCLEEMYGVEISYGALYYDAVKHREVIAVTEELRNLTRECAGQMHEMFRNGIIPKANRRPRCRSCSISNICLPEINDRPKVSSYLKNNLYESVT